MNTTTEVDPAELWIGVIPETSTPMIFCSIAALLASVFLGRWVGLSITVRQLEAIRLEMGINVEKRDPKMAKLVEILEARTERGFRQMRYTRVTAAAFNGSVMFFLIASFINGLSALDFNTTQAVPALMIIGGVLLVAGTIVAIVEVLTAVPTQSKNKIDEVLEFEKSEEPVYNILAAIETTARQSTLSAFGPALTEARKNHQRQKSREDLKKTIELLEDIEDRELAKKRHKSN